MTTFDASVLTCVSPFFNKTVNNVPIVDLNSVLDMTIKAADKTSKSLVVQQVSDTVGADLVPVTSKKEFFFLGYSKSPTITISQDDPLPIKILGMSVEVVFA